MAWPSVPAWRELRRAPVTLQALSKNSTSGETHKNNKPGEVIFMPSSTQSCIPAGYPVELAQRAFFIPGPPALSTPVLASSNATGFS